MTFCAAINPAQDAWRLAAFSGASVSGGWNASKTFLFAEDGKAIDEGANALVFSIPLRFFGVGDGEGVGVDVTSAPGDGVGVASAVCGRSFLWRSSTNEERFGGVSPAELPACCSIRAAF